MISKDPKIKFINEKKQKKNLSALILTAFVIILVLSIIFLFFNRSGKIQGQIVDSKNTSTSLTGVLITVDEQSPKMNNNLTGTFYFEGIKPGKHIIKFSKDNYQISQQEVNLKAGEKLNLNLIPMTYIEKSKISNTTKFIAANYTSNTISVVESGMENKITEIPLSLKTIDMISVPEKNKLYCSSTQGSISVVNLNTNNEIKKIDIDKLPQLLKLQLSASKDKLYVLGLNPGKIFVIDTNTDQVIEPPINVIENAVDFVIDKSTGNFIVLDSLSINIINTSGNIIKTHKFQKENFYNKIYLGTNYVLVSLLNENSVIHIDLITDKETKLDFSGKVKDIEISTDNIYVLLPNFMSIVKITTLDIYKTNIDINGSNAFDMILSPEQTKLYISDYSNGKISDFDIKSEKLMADHSISVLSPSKIIKL